MADSRINNSSSCPHCESTEMRLLQVEQENKQLRQQIQIHKHNETKFREVQRIAAITSWEVSMMSGKLTCHDDPMELFPSTSGEQGIEALFSRIPEPDKQRFKDTYNHALNSGQSYEMTHILMAGDGSKKVIRHFCKPFFSAMGTPLKIIGLIHDITDLAAVTEAAMQAVRVKSEFMANMSHEIRTPMNGVYGSLQLLADESMSEQAEQYVNNALYSTEALIRIVNDILDYSKMEAGKIELENSTFSLSDLLQHALTDLTVLTDEKDLILALDNQVQNDHWNGDPLRIRQILLNVISNAIKFTEQGQITVSVSAATGQLTFVVEDTGIGMDQETIARIFERFEQADSSITRKFGGTGLGMPITKSLVDLMAGDISIHSDLNKGTRITINLPLSQSGEDIKTATKHPASSSDLTQVTVLLAEDHPVNQMIVKAMLQKNGATVLLASNGLEAIEQCDNNPDLILMDIQMPEMDGITACLNIKAERSDIPILALTANVLPQDIEKYNNIGFDGHIGKPVEQHTLLQAIQHQLKVSQRCPETP